MRYSILNLLNWCFLLAGYISVTVGDINNSYEVYIIILLPYSSSKDNDSYSVWSNLQRSFLMVSSSISLQFANNWRFCWGQHHQGFRRLLWRKRRPEQVCLAAWEQWHRVSFHLWSFSALLTWSKLSLDKHLW